MSSASANERRRIDCDSKRRNIASMEICVKKRGFILKAAAEFTERRHLIRRWQATLKAATTRNFARWIRPSWTNALWYHFCMCRANWSLGLGRFSQFSLPDSSSFIELSIPPEQNGIISNVRHPNAQRVSRTSSHLAHHHQFPSTAAADFTQHVRDYLHRA